MALRGGLGRPLKARRRWSRKGRGLRARDLEGQQAVRAFAAAAGTGGQDSKPSELSNFRYGPLEALSEILDVLTRGAENLLQSLGRVIGLGGGENEEDDAEARGARRLLIRFFALAFALPWVVSTTLRVAVFAPSAKAFVSPASSFVQPTEHQKDEMASKCASLCSFQRVGRIK